MVVHTKLTLENILIIITPVGIYVTLRDPWLEYPTKFRCPQAASNIQAHLSVTVDHHKGLILNLTP